MMRAEDMGDEFWNVKAREEEEENHLRRKILELKVQRDLVAKADQIRNAPGFQDFLKTIQGLHVLAREALIGDPKLTNDGLREQRGKVKGLESVLALLTKPQIAGTLEAQLAELTQLLAEAMKRRPKPKPEPEKVSP